MTETATPRKRLNLDVECLRCGAMNIPENHICGRCGASLPMIYDSEGQVYDSAAEERREQMLKARRRSLIGGPNRVGWFLRLAVILFALLFALWIMSRR